MAEKSPASIAINALCQTLVDFGASPLDPNAVRQAKFNGPVSPQLWRALHDLVILRILDFKAQRGSTALTSMWCSVADEQLLTDDGGGSSVEGMTPEGTTLVLRHLSIWGCPPDLLARLQPPPSASSRHLLLALAWLVAQSRLFQRVLARTQLPLELLQLLPPYPQDTSGAPATQQAYSQAVQQAQAHVSAIHAMLAHASSPLPHSSSYSSQDSSLAPSHHHHHMPLGGATELARAQQEQAVWLGVEGRSQQAMCLMGRLRSQLSAVQSLDAARRKLGAQVCSTQTLSPFELHLATHPCIMDQYMKALATAAQVLEQQQQLAAAAKLLFQWCGSVQEEQAKADAATGCVPQRVLAATQVGGTASDSSSSKDVLSNANSFLSSVDPQALNGLRSLPSVAHSAGAKAASALLARLEAQLRAAYEEAGPLLELAATKEARGQRPSPYAKGAGLKEQPAKKQSQPPSITLEHFKALAERAVSLREAEEQQQSSTSLPSKDYTQLTPSSSQQQRHRTPSSSQAHDQLPPSHSLPQLQQPQDQAVPPCDSANCNAASTTPWDPASDTGTPWALPPDVCTYLASLQPPHQRQQCQHQQQEQQEQHTQHQPDCEWQHQSPGAGRQRRAALALQKLGNAVHYCDGESLTQQQQQQQCTHPSVYAAQAVYGAGAGGRGSGHHVLSRGRVGPHRGKNSLSGTGGSRMNSVSSQGRRGSELRGWTSGVSEEGDGAAEGARQHEGESYSKTEDSAATQSVQQQESVGAAVQEEADGSVLGDTAQETDRLVAMTLGVARALAKTRASHKHTLQQCAQALPDCYLVGGL